MTEEDIAYYERRADEEKQAATAATAAEAASAHRLLAIEYEAHARELRMTQSDPAGRARGLFGRHRSSEGGGHTTRPTLSIR